MKKVLFFLESLAGGGAEKVLTDIVSNLDKNKYDITVCTVTDNGIYEEKVKNCCRYKSFIKMSDYNKGGIKKLVAWAKIKAIYKLPSRWIYRSYIKEKYDIEIAFIEGFATKFISKSNNLNSKKIAWVHTDMISNPYADNSFRNLNDHIRAYQKFSNIVCVSADTEKHFFNKFHLNNTVVIYNPIDKSYIQKYLSNSYSIKDKIKICAVGRLEYQKGFDRLINVLAKICKSHSNFELKIIGTGSKKDDLQKSINDLNLQDKIKLLGFLKNPYEEMGNSNLLVCSSRNEGFSLVVAEAMCLGIPILTTKCDGPIELTQNGEYGILVENSSKGLYDGLMNIFTNPNTLYTYHDKSLIRCEFFDIKKTLLEVEKILDE